MSADKPRLGSPTPEELEQLYVQRAHEVERFRLFEETFQPDHCDEILYVGCGGDTSPTRAFANKRVINVDIHKPDIDLLRKQEPKAETYVADGNEFIPPTNDSKVDLLIFSGSYAHGSLKNLREGGFLLVKATPDVIDKIRTEPGMKLMGILWENRDNPSQGNHYRIVKANNDGDIEKYIQPVESDSDIELLGSEDPLLLEQVRTRRAMGATLQAADIAKEMYGYIPRKQGHTRNRPNMFIFQKFSSE